MMIVLHPTYTIRLEIQDRFGDAGNGYFNGLTGKTGCDEALSAVKVALETAGVKNFTVHLEQFEHRS